MPLYSNGLYNDKCVLIIHATCSMYVDHLGVTELALHRRRKMLKVGGRGCTQPATDAWILMLQ